MNLAGAQDKKPLCVNQLYFYMVAMNKLEIVI